MRVTQGQVTTPLQVRRALGIQPGSDVELDEDQRAIVTKARRHDYCGIGHVLAGDGQAYDSQISGRINYCFVVQFGHGEIADLEIGQLEGRRDAGV